MTKNNITLTLGQIAAGSIIGLAGGWICLLIFENLIWQFLLGSRVSHGFLGRLISPYLAECHVRDCDCGGKHGDPFYES